MTSRPAIDPSADYTVLSATAARRQLAFESGLSRAATAQMGLEELQTTIARAMPPEIGAKVVVASDKGFARMQDAFHAETRRIVGGDVDVDAPVMSRTKAEEALREHVTDLPDGEPTINLEDAVAGLRGVRPCVLEDADFERCRTAAHAVLATIPTGRPGVSPAKTAR